MIKLLFLAVFILSPLLAIAGAFYCLIKKRYPAAVGLFVLAPILAVGVYRGTR